MCEPIDQPMRYASYMPALTARLEEELGTKDLASYLDSDDFETVWPNLASNDALHILSCYYEGLRTGTDLEDIEVTVVPVSSRPWITRISL